MTGRVTAIAAALALALAGCETEIGEPAYGSNGVSAIQFKDLPVPAEFRLLERFHESDSVQAGDYRYGNFTYRGQPSIAEASAFLESRMPQHSWRLIDSQANDDGTERELVFRRNPYTATCQLSQHDSLTELRIQLRTQREEQ